MRFEHVYEVDPALMTEHVRQQAIPDLGHAAHGRRAPRDHLDWIQDHFADERDLAARSCSPRSTAEEADRDEDSATACCPTTRCGSIETIEIADRLGFHAVYGADETLHKDLWFQSSRRPRDKTQRIRFGPNVTHVILREPTMICRRSRRSTS